MANRQEWGIEGSVALRRKQTMPLPYSWQTDRLNVISLMRSI